MRGVYLGGDAPRRPTPPRRTCRTRRPSPTSPRCSCRFSTTSTCRRLSARNRTTTARSKARSGASPASTRSRTTSTPVHRTARTSVRKALSTPRRARSPRNVSTNTIATLFGTRLQRAATRTTVATDLGLEDDKTANVGIGFDFDIGEARLRASVDWFNIEVDGVFGTTSTTTILEQRVQHGPDRLAGPLPTARQRHLARAGQLQRASASVRCVQQRQHLHPGRDDRRQHA